MEKWLKNKGIVVIGGTAGLGLSAALAFVRHGAKVVVVGRQDDHVYKAQTLLKKNGIAITADATSPSTAPLAIEKMLENFNTFDGIYHVAGGSGRKFGDGPLHQLTLEGWNKTFSLNLTSLMLSNQAAVQSFLAQKKPGVILNMTSVLGFSPSPQYFATHAYAAAKAAVIGFTRSIASYYAPMNIRVNAIAPALFETPMARRAAENEEIMEFIKTKQPLDQGRIGQPEDIDGAAVYFLSDQSKFTTGQILTIDGGWDLSEGQYGKI